jgi:hypothetical protein
MPNPDIMIATFSSLYDDSLRWYARWTPKSQYTQSKSRYANATSSRVVAVRECQFFTRGAAAKGEKEQLRVQASEAERSLGDAKSSLGDAESSLGDAKSSLGDAKSSLGDAKS